MLAFCPDQHHPNARSTHMLSPIEHPRRKHRAQCRPTTRCRHTKLDTCCSRAVRPCCTNHLRIYRKASRALEHTNAMDDNCIFVVGNHLDNARLTLNDVNTSYRHILCSSACHLLGRSSATRKSSASFESWPTLRNPWSILAVQRSDSEQWTISA